MSSEIIHEVSEQRSRNMSAIKSKNTKPEIKVRKFYILWDIDSDFIQKIYRGLQISFSQNIKLLSLSTDVSGIGMRIASMPLHQKQGRNSGTKNSKKI